MTSLFDDDGACGTIDKTYHYRNGKNKLKRPVGSSNSLNILRKSSMQNNQASTEFFVIIFLKNKPHSLP